MKREKVKEQDQEVKRAGVMATRFMHLGAKLDELVDIAGETGSKIDYRKRMDELKSKVRLAQQKVDELKAVGQERWGTIKSDVQTTWNELEETLKKKKS